MLAEKDAINKENISYSPAGPNSNTVVTSELQSAKLPLPTGNGPEGPTFEQGADQSVLKSDYSAERGYAELAENAAGRGLADIGHDVGAVLRSFKAALQAKVSELSAAGSKPGLHGLALAAGAPSLGGFAPVAAQAGRGAGQKIRGVAPVGEGQFVVAGSRDGSLTGNVAAGSSRAGTGASYRTVLSQARQQAEAKRVQREAERLALHLPPQGRGVTAMSFAPVRGLVQGQVAGLRQGAAPSDGTHGFSPADSLHTVVTHAEAAFPKSLPAMATPSFSPVEDNGAARMPGYDLEQALDEYFFRQSRLPPAGGAAFNPLLSPAWAGLKLPG